MKSYRNKNKRSWKTVALLLAIPLIWLGVRQGIRSFYNGVQNDNGPVDELKSLWDDGQYSEVHQEAIAQLSDSPLDRDYLFLVGASSFYIAISQSSEELKQQYLNQSIIHLRKLLSLQNHKYVDQAYYLLGKSYLNKGSFYAELALEAFSNIHESSSVPSDFLEHMAQAHSYLGNYQESIYYLNEIAEISVNDRIFQKLAENSFGAGQYDQAEAFYLRALEITEDVILRKEMLFQLATLYYDLKNYSQAQKVLSQYLEIDYNNRDAHFLLGESYFYLGDISSARLEWHRAERIDPYYRPVLIRLYN